MCGLLIANLNGNDSLVIGVIAKRVAMIHSTADCGPSFAY